MGKKRTTRGKRSTTPDLPVPTMRAWHVVTGNGGDATVTAHECHTYDGVLSFETYEPVGGEPYGRSVLKKAFSRVGWKDVELVEIESADELPDIGEVVVTVVDADALARKGDERGHHDQ